MSGDDLKPLISALKDRSEELAAYILGSPKNPKLSSRARAKWGSKGSFSLRLTGAKRGMWSDYEADIGGDPLNLISFYLTGWARKDAYGDAIRWARRWLGWPEKDEPEINGHNGQNPFERIEERERLAKAEEKAQRDKAAEDEEELERLRRIAGARSIWKRSRPISGTPGERYLTETRRIPAPAHWPEQLRFDRIEQAVVVNATDADGHTKGVQIVRVTDDGQKIGPHDSRLVKQSYGVFDGAAVRLPGPEDGPLLVAEGPETGLSVWAATGYETWITLGSLAKFQPIAGRSIILCRDDDKRYAPSQRALRNAAKDWARQGFDIKIASPWDRRRENKNDFNDLMKEQGPAAVRARIDLFAIPQKTSKRTSAVSLAEGRSRLDKAAEAFFEIAKRTHLLGPPVHAIRVTLGGGKTEAAIRNAILFLISLRAQGDERPVAIAVPEHKLSAEIAKRFQKLARRISGASGLRAAVWRGREANHPTKPNEKMCGEIETVHKAQAVLADVDKEVCAECPLRAECTKNGYLAQKGQSADLWVVGHKMLFRRMPKAVASDKRPVAALVVDESPMMAGLTGVEGSGTEIALDLLDPGAMPVPDGKLFGIGDQLKETRSLLKAAVRDEPDGPVHRNALLAVGFDNETGPWARAMEWRRKVDEGPWQERKANRTVSSMSALWDAVGYLMGRNGPESSSRLILGRNRDGARVFKVSGRRDTHAAWHVPTLLIDALLEPSFVQPFWPQVCVTAEIEIETPHEKLWQAAGRAFSKAMLSPVSKYELTDEQKNRRAKNRRKLRAFILNVARQNGGHTLVVGNKEIIEALNLPSYIHAGWFNAVAGRDEWLDGVKGEQIRTQFIIGRPQAKPRDVERIAGALTGAAIATIPEWYSRCDAIRLLRQGNEITSVPGETEGHPDPAVEQVRRRIACGEILQAMGRGRGVNRTADNPLDTFVLSDAVLPVPVDGFLEDDAVLNPTLGELMLAEGGVAIESPTDAHAAFPDLWKSAPAARRAFADEAAQGKSSVSFPYNNLLIRETHSAFEIEPPKGLVRVRYKRDGNGQRWANALADLAQVPDPKAWIEARLGSLANFEIVEPVQQPADEPRPEPPQPPQPEVQPESMTMSKHPAARPAALYAADPIPDAVLSLFPDPKGKGFVLREEPFEIVHYPKPGRMSRFFCYECPPAVVAAARRTRASINSTARQ